MEQINNILEQVISNFDFAYMISINTLTYIIIKFIDFVNGERPVKRWAKKLVLVLSTIFCCIIYKYFTDITNSVLINSTILAPVAYSWIFKPILKKLNINYRVNE